MLMEQNLLDGAWFRAGEAQACPRFAPPLLQQGPYCNPARLQTHCFRGFGVIQGPRGDLSDEQPFLAD